MSSCDITALVRFLEMRVLYLYLQRLRSKPNYRPHPAQHACFEVILTDTDRCNHGLEVIFPIYVEVHVYLLSSLLERSEFLNHASS